MDIIMMNHARNKFFNVFHFVSFEKYLNKHRCNFNGQEKFGQLGCISKNIFMNLRTSDTCKRYLCCFLTLIYQVCRLAWHKMAQSSFIASFLSGSPRVHSVQAQVQRIFMSSFAISKQSLGNLPIISSHSFVRHSKHSLNSD